MVLNNNLYADNSHISIPSLNVFPALQAHVSNGLLLGHLIAISDLTCPKLSSCSSSQICSSSNLVYLNQWQLQGRLGGSAEQINKMFTKNGNSILLDRILGDSQVSVMVESRVLILTQTWAY